MNSIPNLILGLMIYAPVYFVWGAALLACARHKRNRPRACKLTVLAVAIAIFEKLILPLLLSVIYSNVPITQLNQTQQMLWMYSWSFLFACLTAISWGILLWVIFRLNEGDINPYGQDWQLPK